MKRKPKKETRAKTKPVKAFVSAYSYRAASWTETLKTKVLRPCPLCGFKVEILKHTQGVFYNDRKLFYHSIRCPECGLKTRRFHSKAAALSYWRNVI